MGYGSFKQYDSRWGKKNYNGSSTMAVAGCGPTSVANLAHAVNSKITPIDTMRYMQKHGYAIRDNGTDWDGIPACMKHFGLTGVKNINVDNSMDRVWEYLAKGYCADFLFKKGSRGGVCWTTSGHFVAIIGYKVKNGKHYLRTMDSGGRNHDGWYCYETQMRGLIRKVWVGIAKPKEPPKKPTGKYSGTIPKPVLKHGSRGSNTKDLQRFLNWYLSEKLVTDGIFGDLTESALERFQYTEGIEADGIYGSGSQRKAKAYKG